MPELPEVEYVGNRLKTWLKGAKISACIVHDPRIVKPASAKAFVAAVVGRTVKAIDRKGKWLRVSLSDGTFLFSHLAMTGWFEEAHDEQALRFERVRITASRKGKKRHVVYIDSRRWGRLFPADANVKSWEKLGPDALSQKVDVEALHAKLARRKKGSIKEALMDQRLIAGVGNIQAAEALWKAKIDPKAPAASVTSAELHNVMKAITWTIDRTLADLEKGESGKDDPFLIYGHVGQPCPRCKTKLERFELGGRTTTYCPFCQKSRAHSKRATKAGKKR